MPYQKILDLSEEQIEKIGIVTKLRPLFRA